MVFKVMNIVDSLLTSGHKFDNILSEFNVNSPTKIVSFVNPFSYHLLLNSDVTTNVDILFSDGALHTMLHTNFVAKSVFERASFDYSSIASNTFSYAEKNNYKVALIGGTSEEIQKAKTNIIKRYPLIKISYSRNGYFNSENEYAECLDNLESTNIVIIGMGTPLQEGLCSKVKEKYSRSKMIFTCGGFLTQTAIKDDYYHPIIKKFGLRWLQRAYMHEHVRKRLINEYPIFIIKYIYQHISNKIKN